MEWEKPSDTAWGGSSVANVGGLETFAIAALELTPEMRKAARATWEGGQVGMPYDLQPQAEATRIGFVDYTQSWKRSVENNK